jgi:DNA-binding HxlR family transcriptional regulator
MASRRTYGDRCGIARALDLVGERWALLVVRELLLGPKRFTDLRAGLPNVGPDVLSQRLRELEESGIVARRTLPAPAASRVYELTPMGEELEEVLLALGRFGSRTPLPPGGAPLGIDATVLALPTLFDTSAADGLSGTFEVRLGEQVFRARVEDGRLDVTRGEAGAFDAAIATDPDTLTDVLWHGGSLDASEREGDLQIEGDRAALERFLALFPPPRPRR